LSWQVGKQAAERVASRYVIVGQANSTSFLAL